MDTIKYQIGGIDMILPNTNPIAIETMRVCALDITKDFDDSFFPILHMVLNVSKDMYYQIIENKTTVKFRINLNYLNLSDDRQLPKTVFNALFTPFIDENTPYMERELTKKVRETEGTKDTVSLRDFENTIELYLFKEESINDSKKITNVIIKEGSMLDVVTYLFVKSGITSNVLMETLDNRKVYKDIIIPPANLLGNLAYLENQYGFYNTWSTLFFDIDRIYLLSKKGGCWAYSNNEPKKVMLNVSTNTNPSGVASTGVLENGVYKYYVTKNAINISSLSITEDAIVGNNTIMINSITGESNQIDSVSIDRVGNYKVMVTKYDNPFIVEAEKNDNEDSYIVNINLKDFDMRAFTPNKEFVIYYEDEKTNKEYGGVYRLTKLEYVFAKDGSMYSISGIMTLKKRKK